jgi:AcrR family transcriptional regulator
MPRGKTRQNRHLSVSTCNLHDSTTIPPRIGRARPRHRPPRIHVGGMSRPNEDARTSAAPPSAAAGGLRERKKARTRESIQRAALELFTTKGYARTTTVEVAEAAEVAPATFFKHFPTKEDVVLADSLAIFQEFADYLELRDASMSTIDACKTYFVPVILSLHEDEARRLRNSLLEATPELQAAKRRRGSEILEPALAAAFARDLHEPPDSFRPRFLAAIMVSACNSVETEMRQAAIGPQPTLDNQLELFDQFLAMMRGAVAAAAMPDLA